MRSKQASALLFSLLAVLLSHSMLIPVLSTSIADQKTYYSPPDPHAGTPPTGSHGSPIPPSHGNGGSPPHYPTPTPSTPSTPPSGGGGYYNPPSSGGGSPPYTPVDPGTPITPSTPSTPSTPTPSIPTTPVGGTCYYWLNHPGLIWGVLGWQGTLGNCFGATNIPGFGTNLNLLQALSNTRTDGFGALLREGTASYLNSLATNRFPFTTKQVRASFVSALSSNKAAANQASVFKLANEGKIKPRA